MTLYFCVDDRYGLRFNHRRQSRDASVLEDICSGLEGALLIDPMSQRMVAAAGIPFALAPAEITMDLPGAHYFVEGRPTGDWIGLADRVVLYHWNRHYPADVYFDVELSSLGFMLAETAEFPGKSHERITREVYVKC